MRDLGSIQSPQNAFILNLGLESLHVRMAKHCENGQAVAEFLENHPKVAYVNYCGLPGDKYHALAEKYLPNGSCGVVSFGLVGGRDAERERNARGARPGDGQREWNIRGARPGDGQRERNIRAAGPAECEETRKSGNAGVNKEKAKVTIEKREAIMYNDWVDVRRRTFFAFS